MQPLGRDRLGRLVYEGDVLKTNDGWRWVAVPPTTEKPWMFYLSGAQYDVVDLAASPKRSNFERYFGDIEKHRVTCAADAICNEICESDPTRCGDECPFDEWAYSLGGSGLCLCAFINWLDMEATV